MEVKRITVWVTGPVARGLENHIAKARAAEKAWIAAEVMKGRDKRDVRKEALGLRPERWPVQDVLVTRAVERRLGREDLAGPWKPLTPPEETRMRLAGRWPGPDVTGLVAERQFGLPADLLKRLRTASWRVSEEWLRLLEEEDLIGRPLDGRERERRDELAAHLMPPPRIVREALAAPFALMWKPLAKANPSGEQGNDIV
ncbi:hypothetical protein [Kitasatospora aburaviensis]|uniref:Uncharacterized protein n=1 Tax=Kitasatospora aburaviensis TaxID=67265 RepID=A0ABW1F639_9ACTN